MAGTNVRVILPNLNIFNSQRYLRVVETTLDMIAEDILIDFQVTTRTWNDKPLFTITKGKSHVASWRNIGTDSQIYKFVSGGTKVRYATMTKNFRAKTVVGQIRSRVGKGGVAFISRKHPRPGIQARKFDEAIWKKWRRQAPKLMQRAIDVESQRR